MTYFTQSPKPVSDQTAPPVTTDAIVKSLQRLEFNYEQASEHTFFASWPDASFRIQLLADAEEIRAIAVTGRWDMCIPAEHSTAALNFVNLLNTQNMLVRMSVMPDEKNEKLLFFADNTMPAEAGVTAAQLDIFIGATIEMATHLFANIASEFATDSTPFEA